ncbi:predicted protein [Nematostella vectensis]|uniref:Gamma-sarcoglycan n=1 Tax=Nematostella vectensis TaxID=45351 RepID=A7SLK0_NEMVE|nr:zeta-sarcoglycan [Nematostella vectensis]EDO35421.1 predicted protein [Nematostella vectensis]|eukprot:XP_001627521.1 predicted protein [Nematostella vectensis]
MARDKYEVSEIDWANQDPATVIYKVGIYGWRKRCIYFLILLIMVLAVINLSLTIWIMRVMDFNWEGMGNLRITDIGVKLYGHAEFVESLYAKELRARMDEPLLVQSTRNLTVNARDRDGNITAQLFLGDDQIVAKNKRLWIVTDENRQILYADKDKIIFNASRLEFSSPYGAEFTGSVQTKAVRSPPKEHLTLESLTRQLHLNAPEGIQVKTVAGGISLQSLTDVNIRSKKGKITLDAQSIMLKNIPLSKPASGVSSDACEVCVSQDGSIFYAADGSGCKGTCNL